MTRAGHARRHGSREEDVAAVRQFATEHGLTVGEVDARTRRMVLTGTVAQFSAAFRVQLSRFEYHGAFFRGRSGPLHVPSYLADIVEGVFGLDNRPQAEPRLVRPRVQEGLQSFTPRQIANLYEFPLELDGRGQTVGILELGGGFTSGDLDVYFARLGLQTPSVVAVSVDGGQNRPIGDSNSADGEVMLDIEVVGAIAPAATIVVYFAPNSERGFIDALFTAVHDDAYRPSALSISWGSSEDRWTEQGRLAFEGALQDAAALGVSVFAASGDSGSSDGRGDGHAHVDFPAAAPHAIGCGGTRLNSADGVTIDSEVVWNGQGATGGGISEVFDRPAYQTTTPIPSSVNPGHAMGRGAPDVAGVADPETGYQVRADGDDFTVGGTSAVAPLWAGLIALINQYLGCATAGFLNPMIYLDDTFRDDFRDITQGDNGDYQAASGWDPCTGWGSPRGRRVLNTVAMWVFVQFQESSF
jgi:kumamolisin